MKVALIGCGSIGKTIAQNIIENKIKVELKSVYDIDVKKATEFAKKFHTEYKNFDEIMKEDLDLVIEVASQDSVRTLTPKALKAKNIMIMSTGALVDEKLFQEIKGLAKKQLKNFKSIRCPLYGFASLSSRENLLLGTIAMQRLARIKQIAHTYVVYPSASTQDWSTSLERFVQQGVYVTS